MELEPVGYLLCVVIGLGAGVLGGFLGIGGSLIIIPAMAFVFHESLGDQSQHLYQASAMIVNMAVALAAVILHIRAGAVRRDALLGMMPAALILISVGVVASNRFPGKLLQQMFALFLMYVIALNIRRLVAQLRRLHANSMGANHPDPDAAVGRAVTVRAGVIVGAIMGFTAGLLGIGGGGIAVPLQQVIFRVPLRHCIGTSMAVICVTSGVGAIVKNLTLAGVTAGSTHPFTYLDSLSLAALLMPGAVLGAFVGAGLTHRLPTVWVRAVFIVLLCVAASKMAGLWG